MIASTHNEQLKQVRKLHRRRGRELAGRFVAEGEDLLAAAASAGWSPVERFVAAGAGLGGTEVEPGVLARVSTLGSGTRAIGVYEQRWAAGPLGPLCLCLDGVRDPGNVGAAIRSAMAFGASCVAVGPDTADPYGPKAVRASMGAIFAVPLARVEHPAQLPGERIALSAKGGQPLRGPASGDVSVIVGSERVGLSVGEGAYDRAVHIPIAGDSLNAAMAATVALYELTREPLPGGGDSPHRMAG